MRILVTGANGFVGRAFCGEAVRRGFEVRGITRSPSILPAGVENIAVGSIDDCASRQDIFTGCDVVVHLAARVHVMRDDSRDPLAEFRRVNTAGTIHLARSAAASGVKRLVYVSSIKVNGEETIGGRVYTEWDAPAPQDPYGISKCEAELALRHVAAETGLEFVIVRPPLVYGAGVKGNFAKMLRAVQRGIPLPLGSVNNQRDLIYVGNLADALIACSTHAAAAGQTYLVSDGETVSTPDLLRFLAEAMGISSRVFPFPPSLLRLAGRVTGMSMQIERLLGDLQINSDKICHDLDWKPPYSMKEGLQKTVGASLQK